MKKRIGLLVMIIWAIAPKAFADVTFYGQCNYSGPAVTLDAGEYTANALARVGIPNDAISSLKVPDGFEVVLYADDNFKGRYGTLKSSDSCLADNNFDKLVSSLTIIKINPSFGSNLADEGPAAFGTPVVGSQAQPPEPKGAVTVYSECNYAGRAAGIGAGVFTNAQINRLGMSNNSISSIQVASGYQAEVYINDFHRGQSGTVTSNEPCLPEGFNNEITSISVRKIADLANSGQEPVVTLFAHCNYRGGSVQLPVGSYDAQGLKDSLVQEDTVSSIKVSEGYTATVFSGPSFDEQALELTADDDCLDNDGMNESLSSLVIARIDQSISDTNSVVAESTQKPSSSRINAQAKELEQGLACVEEYVGNKACDARRWRAIESRCQLKEVALLSDGYLKGHIEAGNCTSELWGELEKRIANPKLR